MQTDYTNKKSGGIPIRFTERRERKREKRRVTLPEETGRKDNLIRERCQGRGREMKRQRSLRKHNKKSSKTKGK